MKPKRILLTIIPLILALLSYIASKIFVISRYGTLIAGIEEEKDTIIFLFLIIIILFSTWEPEDRRTMAKIYISLYLIWISAYFYDLFSFDLKIISIILIAALSLAPTIGIIASIIRLVFRLILILGTSYILLNIFHKFSQTLRRHTQSQQSCGA